MHYKILVWVINIFQKINNNLFGKQKNVTDKKQFQYKKHVK